MNYNKHNENTIQLYRINASNIVYQISNNSLLIFG